MAIDDITKRKSMFGVGAVDGVETLNEPDATKAATWRAAMDDLYAGLTYSDLGVWMMEAVECVWSMPDNVPGLAFLVIEGGAIDPFHQVRARTVGWLSNRPKLGFKKGTS